ncbi:hypothetical protein AA0228_1616 [Gluconobacter frateurii NRIC 0228]|uniref:Uncharacterized protein n=1 Tax=Gluconobacter frateurii NRIC 0228 TaxID=1307946 RepID=A0ABQ0QBN5_9PROT|nr:hypothetical protein AA0228_1616 [Gluconobacter frateurii NRIC 0228]
MPYLSSNLISQNLRANIMLADGHVRSALLRSAYRDDNSIRSGSDGVINLRPGLACKFNLSCSPGTVSSLLC